MFSLPADVSIALGHFATVQKVDIPTALEIALRDWLIGAVYLEPEHELDEDTETAGEFGLPTASNQRQDRIAYSSSADDRGSPGFLNHASGYAR